MRRLAIFMILLAVGCGGTRPSSFSSVAKPMAERMKKATMEKNLADANLIVDKAQQAFDNKRLVPSELNVLKAARDYGANGEWDKATELMTESIRQSAE